MDVFISYSRDDEDVAKDIEKRLKARGLSADLDSKIPPGKPFKDQIIGKIRSCKEVFVLISHNCLIKKDWVLVECGAALALGKTVSPILIGCTAQSLPDVLSHLQAIKYSQIEEGIEACKERTGHDITGDWKYVYRVNADQKFEGISAIFEGTVTVEKSEDRYRLNGIRRREICEEQSRTVTKRWNTEYAELSPDDTLKTAYKMEGVSRGFMFLRIPRKGPITKFDGEAVLLVDAPRDGKMHGTIVHGTIVITRKGNSRTKRS